MEENTKENLIPNMKEKLSLNLNEILNKKKIKMEKKL